MSTMDRLSQEKSNKDLNRNIEADRVFVLEELNASRMFASPMLSDRGNAADGAKRNGELLRISAGLGRKRLKITKYSGKAKGLSKATGSSSPHWVETEMCRKPELILELLKSKR